jgi:aldehyde:ferredoxin oxidoreductase
LPESRLGFEPLWGFQQISSYGFLYRVLFRRQIPEAIDSAGLDAVVFKGKAPQPTVARVHPDGVRFFDATDLWGADTFVTEAEVKAPYAVADPSYGKPGAVVIGPAGEKLLRFAVIENEGGRHGAKRA